MESFLILSLLLFQNHNLRADQEIGDRAALATLQPMVLWERRETMASRKGIIISSHHTYYTY